MASWNLSDHEVLGEEFDDVEIIVKFREDIFLDEYFASGKIVLLGPLGWRFL